MFSLNRMFYIFVVDLTIKIKVRYIHFFIKISVSLENNDLNSKIYLRYAYTIFY